MSQGDTTWLIDARRRTERLEVASRVLAALSAHDPTIMMIRDATDGDNEAGARVLAESAVRSADLLIAEIDKP